MKEILHQVNNDAMNDYKSLIIDEFQKMKQYEFAQGEKYKVRAYTKAIDSLIELPKIESIYDVIGVPHIGDRSRKKIQEIIHTGKLSAAQNLDATINTVNLFTKIHGIGLVTARELVLTHGITSIEELQKSTHLLQTSQQIGLKYFSHLNQRIPRSEMIKHETYLINCLTDNLTGEITGSFRRGSEDSGDIDFLFTSECTDPLCFYTFIHKLKESRYLIETLSQGTHKLMGICRLSPESICRRIDILYTKKHEYPFALLYFTGSKLFNTEMRLWARKKGLSLNEKNITYQESRIVAQCNAHKEIDIFNYLGIRWVEPQNRIAGIIQPKAKILIKLSSHSMKSVIK